MDGITTPPVRSGDPAPPTPKPAPTGEVPIVTAPELGFSGWIPMAFAFGVVLLVLRGLFQAILFTSDAPSQGLSDTSVWFGWIGITAASLALLGAGFTGKQLGAGVRVALVIIGLYFLQAGSISAGDVLTSFVSAF